MGSGLERVRRWWQASPRLPLVRLHPAAGRLLSVTLVVLIVASPLLGLTLTVAGGLLVGAVPGAVAGGLDSEDGRRLVFILGVLGTAFIRSYAAADTRDIVGLPYRRVQDAVEVPIGDGVRHELWPVRCTDHPVRSGTDQQRAFWAGGRRTSQSREVGRRRRLRGRPDAVGGVPLESVDDVSRQQPTGSAVRRSRHRHSH